MLDSSQDRPVAIIGAGIAGLSCAYALRQAGVPVKVFERESSPGGRMRSRTSRGLTFDLGANFLVGAYSHLLELARELGVEIESISPVDHLFYRRGSLHSMNLSSARDVVRMDFLKIWDRFKFLEFYLKTRRKYHSLDFFDLSTIPDELNREDAYSCARREVGQEFADYIVDGFHSCMMFYRSQETSAAAFLALFAMRTDPHFDFSILHAQQGMQELADSLAQRVGVQVASPIVRIAPTEIGWEITTPTEQGRFPEVVLATTAGAAKNLLKDGPKEHRDLLASTRFAGTINVSFRIPQGELGTAHCFYVPFRESQMVAEFTNEALKGENDICDGYSLINAGLHESAALELMGQPDQTIFETVRKELLRLQPKLTKLEAHDLQRWPEAIPKYDCAHLTRVKKFQATSQGRDGLYLCGDYLNSPWLEGASRCGYRVAQQIIRRRNHAYTVSPVKSI